jgi:ribosomal protein L24
VKTLQARTAKKGDSIKVTHGAHAGEKGTLMKVRFAGTPSCVVTVNLDCGKRTIANGYVKYLRAK